MKGAQEDVIRLLAEKKINTNPHTPGNASKSTDSSDILGGLNGKVKENEQNVRNRAREVKFGGDIERSVFIPCRPPFD